MLSLVPPSQRKEASLLAIFLAPVIFNIVVDAILRRWYAEIMAQGLATRVQFYANDGLLCDHDPMHLQTSWGIMEAMFL